MVKQELQELVLQLQNTNSMELSKLVTFMLNRGYTLQQWKDISTANEHVLNALNEFFSTTDEIGLIRNQNNQSKLNLNELKELSDLAKKNGLSNKNKEINKKENEQSMENKNLEVKPETVETVTEPKEVKDETAMTTNEGLTDGSNALKLPPTENENPENKTPEVTAPEKTTPDTPNAENKTPEVTNPDTPKQEDNKGNTPTDNNTKDDNKKDDSKNKTDNNNKTNNKNTKKSGNKSTTPKAKTSAEIRREYKTINNIVDMTPKQVVDIHDVRQITPDKYVAYINAQDLANLWMQHKLVFDPTMQRGVKTDKSGNPIATFSDYHVGEIEKSMLSGEFEPTEIHFAILTDDKNTTFEVDEDNTMTVDGLLRLLDGQHRTRGAVKIINNMKVIKDYPTVDLSYYVFPVTIHVVTSDRARLIYSMIDKNLPLDKSQVLQLMTDDYSTIVNYLNQDRTSVLRDKIATSRPVANKLVLFSTLYEAVKRQFTITIPSDVELLEKYLNEFFIYATTKLSDALGGDIAKRLAWREKNLLNENNFFYAWLAVAKEFKSNYKDAIDKIVANIDYFNKNNPIWLGGQVVKYKKADEKKPENERGFAMSNSTSAFDTIIEKTLELLKSTK